MIIIKCEDELLMLSGNAYIKAIKLDVPDLITNSVYV